MILVCDERIERISRSNGIKKTCESEVGFDRVLSPPVRGSTHLLLQATSVAGKLHV